MMESSNILFTRANEVEVVREPVGEVGPHEVLVQTTQSLISTGTESMCLTRNYDRGTHWDMWTPYPCAPGYSAVGRVVEVGPGVEQIGVGDRVAVTAPHREWIVARAENLYPVPDAVSDEDAAWFRLASIVQHGVRCAEHQLGETVCVVGLGLLGQLTVQYLRLLGVRELIAIDLAEPRLEMARTHGATTVLAMGVEEARAKVLELTNGEGVDVVYDITGNANVFSAALKLLKRFGRLVLLGDTGSPSAQQLTPDVIVKGLRIIGAHAHNPPHDSSDHSYWSHHRMVELFFTYLQRGDMHVTDLVTHRYTVEKAPEAYRMLQERRTSAMGVLFDWTQR